VGSQLELTNLISGETYRARVVAIRRKEGQVVGVAVELLVPSETFWGVNFQLKKTSAELMQLEHAIRSGGIDERILMDFRDAVDHVRKTAWPCRNGRNAAITRHDPHTVLPCLPANGSAGRPNWETLSCPTSPPMRSRGKRRAWTSYLTPCSACTGC